MRCSSAGSICHSPFSSLAAETFPAFDRPQDRGLVPADRRSGCCDGVHGVLPTVSVSRYGATALVKETYLGGGTPLIGTNRLRMAWEMDP